MRHIWTYWRESQQRATKRTGASVPGGEAERSGTVGPGEEMAQDILLTRVWGAKQMEPEWWSVTGQKAMGNSI